MRDAAELRGRRGARRAASARPSRSSTATPAASARPVREPVAALTALLGALEAAGIAAEDVALRRPTLDEVFLHLTGHAAAPEAVAA